MNNQWKLRATKYVLYGVMMLLLYVLETTPGFFTINGVKPSFVVPMAVAIAVFENEFLGGIYGGLAGILCDHGVTSLFGFHSIILTASCVVVGLMVLYLLRPVLINYVFLLFCVFMTRGLLDYLLNYYIWNYPGVEFVLWNRLLPGILYSILLSPLLFFLVGGTYRKFEELLDPS